jgi:hypothetical protein
METKPIYLGSLGVMEYFSLENKIYRTIDYPPSNTSPTYGTRWCLNMTTLKAEFKFCREKIQIVSRETELSE